MIYRYAYQLFSMNTMYSLRFAFVSYENDDLDNLVRKVVSL